MQNFKLNEKDILSNQDWTFPTNTAYGPGRFKEIGDHCNKFGIKNPLIVTDNGSIKLPFIKDLKELLIKANLKSDIFSDISPNPREDEVAVGRKKFRDGKHDSIIAIGGGSAMDGGKLICLTANNEVPLRDFEFELTPPKIAKDKPFPKIITIPTTAGTGAETEITAMVTYLKEGMKFCMWHPDVRPVLALVDPELTLGLPSSLTAWTGVDAMVHAIEGYCVPGFHPLCDGSALESLSLISKSLYLAVEEPKNLVARGGMLIGSYLGGIAFLKGLGNVHAISHMVGAEFNTQHGLTNAIILPVVLKYNLSGMNEKVKRMSEAMQFEEHSVGSFINNIEIILDRLQIPKSLSEIGVTEDCTNRIAEKAMKDQAYATNPKKATFEDMKEMVLQSIKKAR
ncbi:iron-containing alcohol dehydrogenase [Candidatus Pelagibacter sp.]|nr:iron-containing alcohol dehydrogenase [Candidatus Pelagibacter sp.]